MPCATAAHGGGCRRPRQTPVHDPASRESDGEDCKARFGGVDRFGVVSLKFSGLVVRGSSAQCRHRRPLAEDPAPNCIHRHVEIIQKTGAVSGIGKPAGSDRFGSGRSRPPIHAGRLFAPRARRANEIIGSTVALTSSPAFSRFSKISG